ncbi:MAG: nitroreductase/quinone reductase family protein [Caldilineaceae bacterium]
MNPIIKVVSKVHRFVLQVSGGRIGSQMGGQSILLLHHVGAKSNKPYSTPLGFVEKDGAYLLVAAAAGQPNHPGWYYNLKKNPSTTVEIKGKVIKVVAEVAATEVRDQLWAELSAKFSQFDAFQKKAGRVIPIVLLHPQQR